MSVFGSKEKGRRGAVLRRVVVISAGLLVSGAGLRAMLSPSTEEADSSGAEEQRLDFKPATQPASVYDFHPQVRPIASEFQILSRRSIFSTRPIVADDGSPAETGPVRPEREFVLRGVATEAGEYQAFVERVPNARILRLTAGDSVAQGRLRRVNLGGVDYEAGGRVTRIGIGYAFDGTQQEPVLPPSTQPDDDSETPRHKMHKFRQPSDTQNPEKPKLQSN